MAAVWQLLHIRTRVTGDRTTVDANGPGDVLHWADPELAAAWIAAAEQAITPRAISEADAGGHSRQVALLVAATYAIANAYNAMNILWENDPMARRRYREYLAGPPASSTSEYSLEDNYGGEHWYRKDDRFPIGGGVRVVDGEQVRPGDFTGTIPALARSMFIQDYPLGTRVAEMHPNEFRQSVGVYIDAQGPLDAQGRPAGPFQDVRTTKYRINRPYVMGDVPSELPLGSTGAMPVSPENWCRSNQEFECPRWISNTSYLGVTTGVFTSGGGVVCGPRPVKPARELAIRGMLGAGQCGDLDWTHEFFMEALRITISTDDLNPFVPLPLWPPLRAFVPWLRAWIADLASRTPEQIIIDSRKFVVEQNVRWISSYGSMAQFAEAVLGGQAEREAESHTPDPTVQIAATTIVALGAALGTVVPIAAVAGAIIGGGITIINAAAVHPVSGFKDDVGHYKPAFAIGWLGGSGPAFPDPNVGAPDSRRLPVPDPPGFTRRRAVGTAAQGPNAGQTYLTEIGMGCEAWARISDPAARTIRLRSASINRGIDPAEADRRRIQIDAYCASQGLAVPGAVRRPALNIGVFMESTSGKGGAPPSDLTILPAGPSQDYSHLEAMNPPATPVVAPRKVWPWVVGGVVVLGAAGAGGYYLLRDKKHHQ